jgi:hypothetical protein
MMENMAGWKGDGLGNFPYIDKLDIEKNEYT